MQVLKIILILLILKVVDKINCILLSRAYGKKCNYDCKKCGMWSCTNEKDYKNYKIIPYDNFKNICGKE